MKTENELVEELENDIYIESMDYLDSHPVTKINKETGELERCEDTFDGLSQISKKHIEKAKSLLK